MEDKSEHLKTLISVLWIECEEFSDRVNKRMEESIRTQDELAGKVLALEEELKQKRSIIARFRGTNYGNTEKTSKKELY